MLVSCGLRFKFMISVKNLDVAPGLQHLLKLDTVPEDGGFFGFVELILLLPWFYIKAALLLNCLMLFARCLVLCHLQITFTAVVSSFWH
ncbi:hypothetical protein Hanom_Chr11g00975151 [Helianthus anomalus]